MELGLWMHNIENLPNMRIVTYTPKGSSDQGKPDQHLSHNINWWLRAYMNCIVQMKCRPAPGPIHTLEQQLSKKREREIERPSQKREVHGGTQAASAYSLQNTMQWDCRWEYVFLRRGWWRRAAEREMERQRSQMRLVTNTQALFPLIDTLPQPDSFIFKAIVCQCASAHYQPPPAWVSTLLF